MANQIKDYFVYNITAVIRDFWCLKQLNVKQRKERVKASEEMAGKTAKKQQKKNLKVCKNPECKVELIRLTIFSKFFSELRGIMGIILDFYSFLHHNLIQIVLPTKKHSTKYMAFATVLSVSFV